MTVVWFLLALVVLFVVVLFVLYDVIFSGNKRYMSDERSIPKGEQYEPYHTMITECVDQVLAVPYEVVEILSEEGYKLSGRYYHLTDGAPLIIFFHGYRCSCLRDGNGIFLYNTVQRSRDRSIFPTLQAVERSAHSVLPSPTQVQMRQTSRPPLLSLMTATFLTEARSSSPTQVMHPLT